MAAARRRERRSRPASGDPGPAQPQGTDPPTASGGRPSRLLPLIFVVAAAAVAVSAAVYLRSHGSSGSGDRRLSVYDRGLVKTDIGFREILEENSRVSENRSRRHFPNPVLSYVTPWNSGGYEMAKRFSSKLTHISPVWYELKSEGNKLVLEGRHNADLGWISDVRRNGPSLILPRVVLEALPTELLHKKKRRREAIDLIVSECKEMGYDGIVLESWSRWAAFGILNDMDSRSMGLQFIKQLGLALHSSSSSRISPRHMELIYVIPAPRSQNIGMHDFGPRDLQELGDSVDGFSFMTYDFSWSHNPGPNAPLQWVQSCLQFLLTAANSEPHAHAHMVFLGINFFGNDFIISEGGRGGGAITGREYISLLKKHRPEMVWLEESGEHYFLYSSSSSSSSNNNLEKHVVFYPTLKSISLRLDEAKAWGASISIWEIGQGLDYFFDLL